MKKTKKVVKKTTAKKAVSKKTAPKKVTDSARLKSLHEALDKVFKSKSHVIIIAQTDKNGTGAFATGQIQEMYATDVLDLVSQILLQSVTR